MPHPSGIERRAFTARELRITGEPGKRMLSGYAVVYDQDSEPIFGRFIEVVRPGAFANSLRNKPDVRCLFNHDPSLVLGRTVAKTLRLFDDPIGLRVECDLADTQLARDMITTIERGDVDQMSFGFRTIKDRWTFSRKDDEFDRRELIEAEIFDVSPATFAAYTGTSVGVRGSGIGDDEILAAYEAAKKQDQASRMSSTTLARLRIAESELPAA